MEIKLEQAEGVSFKNELEKTMITWKQFLLFLLVFIGAGLLLGFVMGIIEGITKYPIISNWLTGYKGLLFDAVIFGIVLICLPKIRKFALQDFNLAPFRKGKTYLIYLASFLILSITQFIFIKVIGIDDATKQVSNFGIDQMGGNGYEIVLLFISLALLTPIKEEILFRGILYQFLAKRYTYIVGLCVSSIIFGLAHFDTPISGVVMGLVFAFQYHHFKSLAVSMVFHIIWNIYAASMLILTM